MANRKMVELRARETVGYSEAKDKDSFMTGVSLAISIMEEIHKVEISDLELKLSYSGQSESVHKKDLETISHIIAKHLKGDD